MSTSTTTSKTSSAKSSESTASTTESSTAKPTAPSSKTTHHHPGKPTTARNVTASPTTENATDDGENYNDDNRYGTDRKVIVALFVLQFINKFSFCKFDNCCGRFIQALVVISLLKIWYND